MNTADILNAAVAAQNLASNPAHSTWVSANAGSGKTRVLTDRVARLLLAGADPQKILCLTFTKAAAAEMQSRLYRRLGAWSMLDDPALRGELAAIGETVYDDGALRRARTLFAAALETPGGLKIQTIHAFCAHLLRRFPLEAGVSPDFREMEDRAAALLRAEVVDALIAEGDTSFDAFALHLGNEGGLDRVYLGILKHRDGFAGFDRDAVAAAFGVDPAETPDTVRARALARISIANAVAIAENFAALGGANAQKKLPALKAFVTAPEGHRDLRHLVAAFFDAKGANPLKTQGHLVTKAMREAFPAIDDYIHDIQDIVAEARAKQRGLHALAKSEALHRFAGAFLAAYEAAKSRRGLLDFDDLIDRARDLLTVSSMAQWVLYRLDGGIDHILVDEAQDTAPRQWAVVKALTAEFIATGPDARKRTIFVVGDKKQSIFGFQGADPDAFSGNRDLFGQKVADMAGHLQDVDLLHSFRTAAPILALVDRVFAEDVSGALGDAPRHVAFPDRPGRVELWPFVEKEENEAVPRWYEPVDMTRQSDPAQILARQIAEHIQALIADGVEIPVRGADNAIIWRPVTAGDVMVLVRSRTRFFHALIAHLKKCEVPVAGADRMVLGEELAVQDILSLLRFLDTELDDLSLAEALRSPLFGITEAELFALAHGRPGLLWAALRESSHHQIIARLRALRNLVDYNRPYEILEAILINQGGRAALMARLGPDCQDAIDELLVQALAYEQTGTPSLSGFLAWISVGNVDVKREMSVAGGEVRVMTVHGSKGLEAPVVFVPDVAEFSAARNKPAVAMAAGGAYWTLPKAGEPPLLAEAEEARQAAEAREYERLLYVALTRAEGWLIICGAGSKPDKPGRWYARVAGAIEGAEFDGMDIAAEGGNQVIQYRWETRMGDVDIAPLRRPDIPAHFRSDAPPIPTAETPEIHQITPTALAADAAHALPGEHNADYDTDRAMERGRLLHLLLEVLPATPRAEWPARARYVLADDPDADVLLTRAETLLSAPELTPLFDRSGLAEVTLTAPVAGGRMLGKMDLIRVTDACVHGIDFKSNRIVPGDPADTPAAILIQLAAYRQMMAAIWPDKTIKLSVLWTETGHLMAIPDALLAGHLTPSTLSVT